MKTLYPHTRFLYEARKLLVTLPVCFLLQFSIYFNQANGQVLISQVYATNGVAGTTYNTAFIQLFNLSASPVNINGWSVQWRGTSGSYTVISRPNVSIPFYQASRHTGLAICKKIIRVL